ncbi:AraC family transcriptional regulator [Bradyrhizobium manausense]|uniref:AraC family transcriptional regulator n=1 Tax=Bradyrhizobium manausense TaxID=989370 RepID=UPI001BA9FA46|nr:AraC family transcriptional regulator [Bradyrhizobium manausense]MBR0834261.1 AraC family transcriptional regulator [Bradyrhizobium manausense]
MRRPDNRYVAANIPAVLIRCLFATLSEFGLDSARLTYGLGITAEDLNDPDCRVSFRQGREIILRAMKMTKGRALGLETGIREKITSVGLPGYAMLTANTVGDAVKLGLELQKDTGSMLEFSTRLTKEGVVVAATSRFHAPEIYVFLVEEAFASFIGIARALSGEKFRPARVDFAYPAPAHVEIYNRVFGCEIRFDQLENAFVYDSAWSSVPLTTADPPSHRQLLEFLAYKRARAREVTEIVESVERVLRQTHQPTNSISRVAHELGVSERTLRRRLSDGGVSFQELLDRVRKNRALELLANPKMPVERIAVAVGFTDPHNFRRAFRRWTGSTPGKLRSGLSERLAEIDPN